MVLMMMMLVIMMMIMIMMIMMIMMMMMIVIHGKDCHDKDHKDSALQPIHHSCYVDCRV